MYNLKIPHVLWQLLHLIVTMKWASLREGIIYHAEHRAASKKRPNIQTVLSIILFALETTHLLCITQETSQMLSKSTLKPSEWLPLGSTTGFIFHQSFCFTSDDEIACILYSIHWLTHQDDDPQDVKTSWLVIDTDNPYGENVLQYFTSTSSIDKMPWVKPALPQWKTVVVQESCEWDTRRKQNNQAAAFLTSTRS